MESHAISKTGLCVTCRHFTKGNAPEEFGTCHRHAPSPVVGGGNNEWLRKLIDECAATQRALAQPDETLLKELDKASGMLWEPDSSVGWPMVYEEDGCGEHSSAGENCVLQNFKIGAEIDNVSCSEIIAALEKVKEETISAVMRVCSERAATNRGMPMEREIPQDPNALLFPAEAAYLVAVPVRTLEALRLRGGGPPVSRPGGGRWVRYRRADLLAWAEKRNKNA